MIQIDLLLCNPTHMDYPLFRYNLKRFRKYFNKVIIAIVDGSEYLNLEPFIRSSMPDVVFVKPQHLTEDWRHNAVTDMLHESHSPYVLFMEQDFLIKDDDFLDRFIKKARSRYAKFAAYKEGERIHPAFAFVDKTLFFYTSKDFAAHPPKCDHFGIFFDELKNVIKFYSLQNLEFKESGDFYHMAALTQNYHCYYHGEQFYKIEEFLTYNHLVQKLPIPQSPEFMKFSQEIEKKYGKCDNPLITSFFPLI